VIGTLPPALSRYYESFDAGDMVATAACFTPRATYAIPTSFESESGERRVVVGHALAGYFEGRQPPAHCHDVFFAALDGSVCLLEGYGRDRATSAAVATYAAMAWLAPDGHIDRYLSWGTRWELGQSVTAGSVGTSVDARALLTRYMELLDGGDFEGAAACFADSGRFSRPRLAAAEPDRLMFEGRAAIQANFEARGHSGATHLINHFAQIGQFGMFGGEVVGRPNRPAAAYISAFKVDTVGLIADYRTYFFSPAVPVGRS
jgi:ketosteroid isomerase-like protein